MNMYSRRKKANEIYKESQEHGIKVLKTTLDELMKPEYTDEQRKQLVDSAKEILEADAKVSDAYANLEFSIGRCVGFDMCVGTLALSFLLGKGIVYIAQKVSTK